MIKTEIPQDWNEEIDGYTTMILCVPNSRDWLATVRGTIYKLQRGRTYDEKSGSIVDAQAIGKEIFDSIMTCDIATYLERIADALDGGTAQRYSIADIIQALNDIDTGLDIVDMLELMEFIQTMLGKLPSINFNLSPIEIARLILDARFKASELNYLEDQALSLRGINIAQGGFPIQGIYENLGDLFNTAAAGVTGGGTAGMQWAYQVIKGKDIQIGQDLIDTLNSVLFGSIRDGTYDIANNLEGVVEQLEAIAGMEGCHCGGSGGPTCLCNPELAGVVATSGSMSLINCCRPTGFTTDAEYDEYRCNGANFIVRQYELLFKRMARIGFIYGEDWPGLTNDNRRSVTEVYQKIASELGLILNQQISTTITNETRSELITLLTSHYVAYQDEIIANGSTQAAVDAITDDFWVDVFEPPGDYLSQNHDITTQEAFDAISGAAVSSALDTRLVAAVATSTGPNSGKSDDVRLLVINTNVGNMLYFRNEVLKLWSGSYNCVGSFCDCPSHVVITGTDLGGGNYRASLNGNGDYELAIFFNYDQSVPEFCGGLVNVTLEYLTDYVSRGLDSDFELIDAFEFAYWDSDQPFPAGSEAKELYIFSETQFTCGLSWINQGC